MHKNAPIAASATRTGREAVITLIRDQRYRDERLNTLDQLFDGALAEYRIVAIPDEAAAAPPVISREKLIRRVESLRAALHLTASEAATILGLKPRRFYELVRGQPFPEGRLADIEDRTQVVNSLAARDWQAAVALVRGHSRRAAELLEGRRYLELEELFTQLRRDRNAVVHGIAAFEHHGIGYANVSQLAQMIDEPAFDVAAQLVNWIGRGDAAGNRVKAIIELIQAFQGVEDDGAVSEQWDFLFGLDEMRRAEFRHRAERFVRDDQFTLAAWRAFVAAESEATWRSATPVRLEPAEISVDPGADEGVSWQPVLADMGLDFGLYDRRTR